MRIFFWHTVLLGADAFLIDGSLECKFLAYFGTMLLTVAVAVRGGIRLLLHIMPTDPLLKGVHVYMTSPFTEQGTHPPGRRGRNVKILRANTLLLLMLFFFKTAFHMM